MFKKYFHLFIMSGGIIFLPGCQSLEETFFGKSLVIRMRVKSQSNKNLAFENDIVASTSPDISKKIEHTTNKDWFEDSLTEYQELKKSKYIKVYKTYIIPNESRKTITVNIPKNCKYLYVFNRYTSQMNAFPIKINTDTNIQMSFDSTKIDIKETDLKGNELDASIKEDDNA